MGHPNGLWRVLFWALYGIFLWLTVHPMRPSDPWPTYGGCAFLLVFWAVLAAHFATMFHQVVCGFVNEWREEEYLSARASAEANMPIEAFRPDPKTGTLIDVRRPLLDPQMGLTVRR